MKKIAFVSSFILLCLMALPAMAQDDQNVQKHEGQRPQNQHRSFRPQMMRGNSLEGIWQMCTLEEKDGKANVKSLPCLKIIGGDGLYQNIQIHPEGGCVLSEIGNYRAKNDSIFSRRVFSASDSTYKQQADSVKATIKGRRWLIITYTNLDGSKGAQELWMRISSKGMTMRGMSMGRSNGGFSPNGQGRPGEGQNQGQRQFRQRMPRENSSSRSFQDDMKNAMQDMNMD